MRDLTVSKFGGTSVGERDRLFKSADIVMTAPVSRLVVVSATSGTTNLLLELWHHLHEEEGTKERVERLKKRHFDLLTSLEASQEAHDETKKLLDKCEAFVVALKKEKTPSQEDELLSFGERLGSLMMQEALKKRGAKKVTIVDARTVIKTDSQFGKATPQKEQIEQEAHKKLLPLLQDPEQFVVTQGFIGSNEEGITTTLGRGGSDYSAALFAQAIAAKELLIWTDVEGVYTCDPKVSDKAYTISELSFKEAAELAYWGAKVLHPLTLIPAIEASIPIYVGDSLKGGRGGTWVTPQESEFRGIRAVTHRGHQSIVTLSRIKSPQQFGHLAPIFSLLARYKISIDQVTTSEISTSFTIQNPHLLNDEVLLELKKFADVSVEKHLALISLVGPKLTQQTTLLSEVLDLLKAERIRSIFMGASETNFSFLVPQERASDLVRKLHHHFLEGV